MDALSAKVTRLIEFFTNGSRADPRIYQPENIAAEMDPLETVLQGGLSGKHLAGAAFRLLPFAGVDGTGEGPDLTCTLTGALLGDTVAAIIDTSDFSDQRTKFETVISAAGYIEQTSLTDLSAKTYLALLLKE